MGKGKNVILCVDDEKTVLDTLQHQLKSIFDDKYLIEIAASAEEALEVLDDLDSVDIETILIITDWQMPGMKGDEFLVQVKKYENKMIKILLTGQAPQKALHRAFMEGGLDHYIQKPWEKEELKAKIISLK